MIAGKSQESKGLMALMSVIRSVMCYLKEQNSFRAFPCQRNSSECSFFLQSLITLIKFSQLGCNHLPENGKFIYIRQMICGNFKEIICFLFPLIFPISL
jgi:hypothetical protein